MFHGESDGRIVAWDLKGNEVWSFQTGSAANAPVVTYEVAGQQYVAILAGGNRGFELSAPGDSLLAFKLGGTMAPLPAPPEPPLVEPARGAGGGGPQKKAHAGKATTGSMPTRFIHAQPPRAIRPNLR